MGHRLSEDELQKALDFCGKQFPPTIPDDFRAAGMLASQIANNSDPETAKLRLLDLTGPIVDPQVIETAIRGQLTSKVPGPPSDALDSQSNVRSTIADSGSSELDVKAVLDKMNAWRLTHSDCRGAHNFEDEPLGQAGAGGGWVARLEKGKLGLVHIDTSAS